MLTIRRSTLLKPASLVLAYLAGLSLSYFWVGSQGQSTLIDELALLAMLPIAVVGLWKHFFGIGLSARLLSLYFIAAAVSSMAALTVRTDIPVAAPVIGLILDAKFLIFLGALLYLTMRPKKISGDVVLDVCRAIVFVGLVNAPFIVRDILSGGVSLSGIRLGPSNIFGYVPVGLFSHKVNVAMLCSMSLSASLVLYLFTNKERFLLFTGGFMVLLLFASSLKELGVLVGVAIVVFRSTSNAKSEVSRASKKLILVLFLLIPASAFIVGSSIELLVSSRLETYVLQESTRKALYVTSAEIAGDYFPIGSGAGTYASAPSRSLYYSPLYLEYGIGHLRGASEEFSSFLMDVGWPKFIGEAGWIGGGAYFLAYFISLSSLVSSFLKQPTQANVFGVFIGVSVFSSAMASAVFTGAMGLVLCALLFYCVFLDRRLQGRHCCEPTGVHGAEASVMRM